MGHLYLEKMQADNDQQTCLDYKSIYNIVQLKQMKFYENIFKS